MLVRKNRAARPAVVRVRRLAVDRPVMKPDMPPPPMPSPPPSLFCRRTTPIMAIVAKIWMTRMTAVMEVRARRDVREGAVLAQAAASRLGATCRDRPEIAGDEAGAADEGAVDIGDGEEL